MIRALFFMLAEYRLNDLKERVQRSADLRPFIGGGWNAEAKRELVSATNKGIGYKAMGMFLI